jgi:hypothetical protein
VGQNRADATGVGKKRQVLKLKSTRQYVASAHCPIQRGLNHRQVAAKRLSASLLDLGSLRQPRLKFCKRLVSQGVPLQMASIREARPNAKPRQELPVLFPLTGERPNHVRIVDETVHVSGRSCEAG